MARFAFLGRQSVLLAVVPAVSIASLWLAVNGISDFARRAVLVRHAEQIDRRSLNREAEREESGREVERLR